MEIKLSEAQQLKVNQLLNAINQGNTAARNNQAVLDIYVEGILSTTDWSGKCSYDVKDGKLIITPIETPIEEPEVIEG